MKCYHCMNSHICKYFTVIQNMMSELGQTGRRPDIRVDVPECKYFVDNMTVCRMPEEVEEDEEENRE